MTRRPAPTGGAITYSAEFGHVCTCSELPADGDEFEFGPAYTPTVRVAPDVAPTESGSYWYVCSACGAGAWSGC